MTISGVFSVVDLEMLTAVGRSSCFDLTLSQLAEVFATITPSRQYMKNPRLAVNAASQVDRYEAAGTEFRESLRIIYLFNYSWVTMLSNRVMRRLIGREARSPPHRQLVIEPSINGEGAGGRSNGGLVLKGTYNAVARYGHWGDGYSVQMSRCVCGWTLCETKTSLRAFHGRIITNMPIVSYWTFWITYNTRINEG